jgi:hypothetical protein
MTIPLREISIRILSVLPEPPLLVADQIEMVLSERITFSKTPQAMRSSFASCSLDPEWRHSKGEGL